MKLYYTLVKPGIVYGNSFHLIAGGLLAVPTAVHLVSFLSTLVGTALFIASACVANNLIDRDIDRVMRRTKFRPSVTGEVSQRSAITFLAILFSLGTIILLTTAPVSVFVIGVVAYVFYVVIYGYAKRTTTLSTIIGSIPGALPAMAGYVGMSQDVDTAAWMIFALIVLWQMPHFYAISIFRKREYEAAKLPVLGVVKPFETVRRKILVYIVLYVTAVAMMTALGIFGIIGGSLLGLAGLYWLMKSLSDHDNEVQWARRSFGLSLQVSLVFVCAAACSVVLP